MIEYLGLWVLIALTFNMWALLSVFGAKVSLGLRGFWCVVLLVPGVGFLLWLVWGPRGKMA